MSNSQGKARKLKIWTVVKSVIAGLFGVQSEKNRQRDFSHSQMIPFMLVGIGLIGFLILCILALVSVITNQ